jgi:hypothetical protein
MLVRINTTAPATSWLLASGTARERPTRDVRPDPLRLDCATCRSARRGTQWCRPTVPFWLVGACDRLPEVALVRDRDRTAYEVAQLCVPLARSDRMRVGVGPDRHGHRHGDEEHRRPGSDRQREKVREDKRSQAQARERHGCLCSMTPIPGLETPEAADEQDDASEGPRARAGGDRVADDQRAARDGGCGREAHAGQGSAAGASAMTGRWVAATRVDWAAAPISLPKPSRIAPNPALSGSWRKRGNRR